MQVVVDAYFGDYAKTHPMFLRAAWGFTMETATQAMRLVLSGLFESHPRLQLILGHFGETIPFLLARIDEALARDTPMQNFRAQFTEHFHVTTSGFFQTRHCSAASKRSASTGSCSRSTGHMRRKQRALIG